MMQNDQGEARDIVIRGISPALNSVTLNGERMPSAEGDNRRVQMDPNLKEVYALAYCLVPTAVITVLAALFLIFKNRTYWFYTTGFGWMVLALILFGHIYPRLN